MSLTRIEIQWNLIALSLGVASLSACDIQNPATLDSMLTSNSCLSSNASIVGFSDTNINIAGNARIGGSVVLLGNSALQLDGNASIRDTIYAPRSHQVSKSGNAKIGQIFEQDFTVNEMSVLNFIEDLAQKPADQTLNSVTSSLKLVGKGGLNVIRVNGDVSLSSKHQLTFHGNSLDRFIVQIQGNLSLAGNAKIQTEGEITARNLLFIITGDQSQIHMAGNAESSGTFVATRGTAYLAGKGKLLGSLFAWNLIQISGNGLSIDPSPFCPGNWVVASPEPTPSASPSSDPSSSPSPDPSTSIPQSSPTPTDSPSPQSSPTPTDPSSPESEPSPSPSSSSTPVATPSCSGLECGILGT